RASPSFYRRTPGHCHDLFFSCRRAALLLSSEHWSPSPQGHILGLEAHHPPVQLDHAPAQALITVLGDGAQAASVSGRAFTGAQSKIVADLPGALKPPWIHQFASEQNMGQFSFAKEQRLRCGCTSEFSLFFCDAFFQLLEQCFPDFQLMHYPERHRLADSLPGACPPPPAAHRHFSL